MRMRKQRVTAQRTRVCEMTNETRKHACNHRGNDFNGGNCCRPSNVDDERNDTLKDAVIELQQPPWFGCTIVWSRHELQTRKESVAAQHVYRKLFFFFFARVHSHRRLRILGLSFLLERVNAMSTRQHGIQANGNPLTVVSTPRNIVCNLFYY